jgi:hypothetical protein
MSYGVVSIKFFKNNVYITMFHYQDYNYVKNLNFIHHINISRDYI